MGSLRTGCLSSYLANKLWAVGRLSGGRIDCMVNCSSTSSITWSVIRIVPPPGNLGAVKLMPLAERPKGGAGNFQRMFESIIDIGWWLNSLLSSVGDRASSRLKKRLSTFATEFTRVTLPALLCTLEFEPMRVLDGRRPAVKWMPLAVSSACKIIEFNQKLYSTCLVLEVEHIVSATNAEYKKKYECVSLFSYDRVLWRKIWIFDIWFLCRVSYVLLSP